MSTRGPFALLLHLTEVLDGLGVPYALGGSMASSLVGEPRSTVDIDVAVRLSDATGHELLATLGGDLYVPLEAARDAIRTRSSFNLVDTTSALKIDLFVLGDDLLDRMQIERRVRVAVPGSPSGIWVTSPEDQVLRKLDWFRRSGRTSDRQWRDVVGILRVSAGRLDADYLRSTAEAVGLAADLDEALRQSSSI